MYGLLTHVVIEGITNADRTAPQPIETLKEKLPGKLSEEKMEETLGGAIP